jgi:hypothetical protein
MWKIGLEVKINRWYLSRTVLIFEKKIIFKNSVNKIKLQSPNENSVDTNGAPVGCT